MRHLRHVKCGRIYLPKPPKDEVLMLDKLQTLKTAVNLILCEEVCNIIRNIKKLHLMYADRIHIGYDESYIKCLSNLDLLHKLESLNLKCKWNKDHEWNKILRFPSSLKKLSLSGCCLGWEDMTMIGSLPQLEVLDLDLLLVHSHVWSPVNDQFLRLKFLKIRGSKLTDWNADRSHFPVLEKLVLLNLDWLKEIPSGIGEIPTLELIRLECCSESAAISAIKIKEDRLENDDNDDLQVQVQVGRKKLETFEKRVKRKELTINNIQLARD